jgi:hypothetical protein
MTAASSTPIVPFDWSLPSRCTLSISTSAFIPLAPRIWLPAVMIEIGPSSLVMCCNSSGFKPNDTVTLSPTTHSADAATRLFTVWRAYSSAASRPPATSDTTMTAIRTIDREPRRLIRLGLGPFGVGLPGRPHVISGARPHRVVSVRRPVRIPHLTILPRQSEHKSST